MLPRVQTVATGDEFDELFNADACIAFFSSPKDEEAYAIRDEFLIHLIRNLIVGHFGSDSDAGPHQNEDWWPNHTRYLEMVPSQCTLAFLSALHELLTVEFADYRIQICVYEDVMEGTTNIGSMVLYTARVVAEQKLAEWLNLN